MSLSGACVIPARDAVHAIADTVQAVRALRGVDVVIVCDDGSADETAKYAAGAGAIIVTHQKPLGRARSIDSSVNALGILETRDNLKRAGFVLIAEAEMGADAQRLGALVTPVREEEVDLATAVPTGEHKPGVAEDLAIRGIDELTGWRPKAPLTGLHCLTRDTFEVASPLAAGWGADVGLLLDVTAAGLRVREVEVDLRPDDRDGSLAASMERARTLTDVTRALAGRGLKAESFLPEGGLSGLLRRGPWSRGS
ncbi:hypothetical protein [Enemella sp. A6]|uniref:hypothetical protein n=1 Tax=Enemella sp. A6 TaxID=3440152 RepID=UPI003EBBEC6B